MRREPEDDVRFTNLNEGATGWKPKSVELRDGLLRNLRPEQTPGLTNDPRSLGRSRLGEGSRPNELRGGVNTFQGSSGLELRSTDPKTINRGTLESPAAPTKTPPSFKFPPSYDPSKKKNTGGLSAARRHVVPDFFPGQLDQMKLGPVKIQPIGFQGASPQINLRTVAFKGFPKGIV